MPAPLYLQASSRSQAHAPDLHLLVSELTKYVFALCALLRFYGR